MLNIMLEKLVTLKFGFLKDYDMRLCLNRNVPIFILLQKLNDFTSDFPGITLKPSPHSIIPGFEVCTILPGQFN